MLWKGYFFFIDRVGVTDPLVALVFFQSLMNLTGILVLTPWLTVFTAGIDRLINPARSNHSQFIDQTHPTEVVSALEALNKEVKAFAQQSIRTLMQMFETDNGNSYSQLKEYENEITRFYLLIGQHAMNKTESERLNDLSMSVRHWSLAVKDMKDVRHNYDTLQHSPLEGKYRLYQLMRERQLDFYRHLLTVLEDDNHPLTADTTARLRTMHHQLHALYNTEVNRLFQGAMEDIDYSSVMNLLRETGNSNESLLQALDHYMRCQQVG
jgi:phosphate:Na+ symporter